MQNFLVNHLNKTNKNKKLNFIYIDKFLSRYFEKKKIKHINSIYSLSTYGKKDSSFIKKKTKKYVNELGIALNKTHNISEKTKFWSVILTFFVMCSVNHLHRDLRSIKRIKKKFKKNIQLYENKIEYVNYKTFYEENFYTNYFSNDYNKLVRYLIAQKVGLKTNYVKFKSKNLKYNHQLNIKIYFKLMSKLINYFCLLRKPDIIFDARFGLKKTILIFLKSFGKILILPSKIFFYNKKKKNQQINKYNFEIRKKIKIKERDLFDKIFNEILTYKMPLSLIENFSQFYKTDQILSRKIKKIGSPYSLACDDNFKFIAAKIRSNGGKLIAMQHGGEMGVSNFRVHEEANKIAADHVFTWKEKKGFATNIPRSFFYFVRKKSEKNKYKEILILPYNKYFFPQPSSVSNGDNRHFINNSNYDFFQKLRADLKKKTRLKVSPISEEKFHINCWKKKFGNLIKISNNKNSLLDYVKKSKIIVIDSLFCTATYEAIYLNIPFLIIDSKFDRYKNKLQGNIRKMIQMNLIFKCPIKAAIFLNKNYDKIELWWEKMSNSNEFKKFRSNLFKTNKDMNGSIFIKKIKKIKYKNVK